MRRDGGLGQFENDQIGELAGNFPRNFPELSATVSYRNESLQVFRLYAGVTPSDGGGEGGSLRRSAGTMLRDPVCSPI